MIRTFAIGLGISSFRVLIPLMMLSPFHPTFTETWDTVVWLAFGMHALAAEVWINLSRTKSPSRVPAPISELVHEAHRPARVGA